MPYLDDLPQLVDFYPTWIIFPYLVDFCSTWITFDPLGYNIETLIKEELGINTTNISPNSTYIPLTDSFDEILKSHCKFIESVGLEMFEEDKNLPYLYWTPKLHNVPFKHRFIAGSSKCTTKDLSCLLTMVNTTVKDGLSRYNNSKTSRSGVNRMSIVKNSTSLLSSLAQLDVCTAT